MGELGQARHADQADRLAGLYPLSRRDREAAFAQVTVLRPPAVAVIEHDAVAAFAAPGDRRGQLVGEPVGNAVAREHHLAGRGGQHRHAARHVSQIADPEIGAVVTVVGEEPAAVVARSRSGIHIEVVLDEAVMTQAAGDREVEAGGVGAGRRRRPAGRQRQDQDRPAALAGRGRFPIKICQTRHPVLGLPWRATILIEPSECDVNGRPGGLPSRRGGSGPGPLAP